MDLWKIRNQIRESQRVHTQEGADAAGDAGERDVKDVVDRIITHHGSGLGVRTFAALRVPQRGSKRSKYEIDLLIAGPHGLIGLEAKNWGGSLDAGHAGKWGRVTSAGETLVHENPVALIEEKIRSVEAYLAAKGVVVSPGSIHTWVVLTNSRIKLSPSIKQIAGVVRIEDLAHELLPRIGPNHPGFWHSTARRLGLERTVQPSIMNIREAITVLEQLPTWDRVVLYGGKVLRGDIISPGVPLAAGSTLSREQARVIQIRIARSGVAAWITKPKARWIDYAARTHSARITLDSGLRIKLAGRGDEEQVSLASVVSIEFGYRDHSYFDR
jgi:hypothetical protein